MNLIDIVMIIMLIAIFSAVFIGGLSRAVVMLIAMWLGLIGADIFGPVTGRTLARFIPNIESWTAEIIGFFLALAVVAGLTIYLLLRSFQTLNARTRMRLETRGGIPALLATIVLAAVVALASVTILIQATGFAIDQTPPRERPGFVVRQYENASLRPGAQRVAGYVYDATGSWVPGGTPSVIARQN